MSPSKIILVAGPTAAGKSAWALDLARKTRGIIINADAMQIYSGLPILSAQPSAAEQAEIPHALYSVLDPSEHSSAGRWLALATAAIEKAIAESYTPILVGGTGLYFRALLGGLAEMPSIPKAIRTATEKLYDDIGEEKFRVRLAALDSISATKLAKNDRQRLIRAYEVVKHTGKPLSEWQKAPTAASPYKVETQLLIPSRDELYAACDRRFAHMIHQGAIEEAKAFLARGLSPTLPAMKTIGVREIGAYLNGEITLDEAITKAQQATRNYAKRQMTWFRNQKLIPD